jgi:hypothetical protein
MAVSNTLKQYHFTSSPNSRRVRIFMAEKGLDLTLVPVDLGKHEQHSDEYRIINPRQMVASNHLRPIERLRGHSRSDDHGTSFVPDGGLP